MGRFKHSGRPRRFYKTGDGSFPGMVPSCREKRGSLWISAAGFCNQLSLGAEYLSPKRLVYISPRRLKVTYSAPKVYSTASPGAFPGSKNRPQKPHPPRSLRNRDRLGYTHIPSDHHHHQQQQHHQNHRHNQVCGSEPRKYP